MYDDEDLNQEKQEDFQEESQQDYSNEADSLPKGNPISNFVRDPLGSIGSAIMGLLGKRKGKKKSGLKEIWNKIPLKIKIIIAIAVIFLLLAVVMIMLIGDLATQTAVNGRTNAVSALAIDENSTEASKLALELYQNYDSLIGFTTEQLEKIYSEFLNNDSNENNYLLMSGKKEFGEDGGSIYSYKAKRTLYQHIQRTEKYNFNKIVWKEYTHTEDAVDMETEENSELELIFPKGIDEATKNTLLKTTAPYLLTQDIPLGLWCGMVGYSGNRTSVDSNTSEKFTYQVLKEALSKITLNKYDLETVKYQTTYDDYNLNTYTYKYTVNVYSNGYEEIVSRTTPELKATTNTVTQEKRIDGTTQYIHDIFWYVAEAITYDAEIINNFNYTKYIDSDVEQIKNPDSNTLVSKTEINERYQNIVAEQINSNGGRPKDSNGNDQAPTSTVERSAEYIQKEGYTYVNEKEWRDKLTPTATDYNFFDYNTAKEYNTTSDEKYSNYETDKKLVEVSKFEESNPSGTSIFDEYAEEDSATKLFGMSIIDLLDSNNGIYGKYLNGGNVSEYEGIGRNKLKLPYTEVKNILNSLTIKASSEDKNIQNVSFNSYTTGSAVEGALPFVYGQSLGYKVTSLGFNSSASIVVSGISLLKEYIRSFEGTGPDITANGEGVECYTAYLDAGGDLTVGYGINITGNPAYKTQLEELMGTTISEGTLVPVEYVDAIEDEMIQLYYDKAKEATNGLEVKEYQLHALASLAYNNVPISDIATMYTDPNYWDETKDDRYETIYEEYKDNENNVSAIKAEADLTVGLYEDYMSKYINAGGKPLNGLIKRRLSEYVLFSLGYYDQLQRFWTPGAVSPGGINVYKADGSVDDGKIMELNAWFEQNIFGNNIHTNNSSLSTSNTYKFNKYDRNTVATNSGYVIHDFFKATSTTIGTYESGGYYMTGDAGYLYQCPWWALSRGSLYLYEKNPEKWASGLGGGYGDGRYVAQELSSQKHITLYTDWGQLQPGCIMSFDGGKNGHVVFVEAVDAANGYYYVSHCGSGQTYYGITKHKIGEGIFYPLAGFVNLNELL